MTIHDNILHERIVVARISDSELKNLVINHVVEKSGIDYSNPAVRVTRYFIAAKASSSGTEYEVTCEIKQDLANCSLDSSSKP